MVIAAVLVAVLCLSPRAMAVVEILYDFEDVGNTSNVYIDSITSDGAAQNGVNYYSGVVLTPGGGPDGSRAAEMPDPGYYPYSNVGTNAVINYPTELKWSADVNIDSTPSWDDGLNTLDTTLFWAGWQRGTGETHFYVNADGSLSFYRAGTGLFTTTATGLVTYDTWTNLGVTYHVGPIGVGGTLAFYVNGVAVQTITGIDPATGGAPTDGRGNAGSQTIFGQAYNLSVATQLHGLVDNIYIYAPEPSSLSLVMLGALVAVRRRRRRQSS
jgi:hypothetical protein